MLCEFQGQQVERMQLVHDTVSWNRHLESPKLSYKMSSYSEAPMLERPCRYTKWTKKNVRRCPDVLVFPALVPDIWVNEPLSASNHVNKPEGELSGSAQLNPRTMWENIKFDFHCKTLTLGGNLLCSHSKWNTDPSLWLPHSENTIIYMTIPKFPNSIISSLPKIQMGSSNCICKFPPSQMDLLGDTANRSAIGSDVCYPFS